MMDLETRELHVPLEETKAGEIVSIVLSLTSMGVLSVCFSRRVQNVRNWSRLPVVCWLVLLIYIDSMAFVTGTAILSNGFGVNSSATMCSRAILLCLGCYMTTKLLYCFLVERVYIIRRSSKPRLRDPLYLFNSFGMLIPYLVVIILNFYFRFAIFENGKCRIGMKRVAMIPLIAFDIVVYLTSLFLLPLQASWSYKNNRSSNLRTVALRTFIGSCATLVSSVVNLTFVVVLNGEPGWICLMCCNCDILFSVLVLHWITSKDNASTLALTPIHQSNNDRRALQSEVLDYQFGLKEQRKIAGAVTTLVSASYEEGNGVAVVSCPLNAITVESVYIREVRPLGGRFEERRMSRGTGGSDDDMVKREVGSMEEILGEGSRRDA